MVGFPILGVDVVDHESVRWHLPTSLASKVTLNTIETTTDRPRIDRRRCLMVECSLNVWYVSMRMLIC